LEQIERFYEDFTHRANLGAKTIIDEFSPKEKLTDCTIVPEERMGILGGRKYQHNSILVGRFT